MRILFLFMCLFLGTAATAEPIVDVNGLRADEPRIGDVIGYDQNDGEPIYLGGVPRFLKDTALDAEFVYRGTRSVAGEFPTSGWIGNCTANAVALDVVITAAHCKGTGARITFAHRESGKSYPGVCTRHPRYNTRTVYNDWALCKLSVPLPEGSTLVTLSKERPAIGTDTYVNGYGAPNVGTHYWGLAKVNSYSGSQDVVTCGPANLGGGDSGGTLMANEGDRTFKLKWPVGLAINSRGNDRCSWYNYYGHSEMLDWVPRYETANSVKICGHGQECKKSDPDPIDCLAAYEELGECLSTPQAGCRDLYSKFSQCVKDQ